MTGGPRVEATAEEQKELRALARSSDREEADRARALLLSLAGWSSFRIAEAFAVKPDSVRHWRWMFGRKEVAGLRARKAPGPAPVKATAALAVVETLFRKTAASGRDGPCRVCRRRSPRKPAFGSRHCGSAEVMRKKGAFAGGDRGTR